MRSVVLGIAMLLTACTGDAPKDTGCTGAIYDPCNSEHDCANMMCLPFGTFTSCTQACTAGDNTTCPKQNGMAATCNANGLCEPAAPNMCKLP